MRRISRFALLLVATAALSAGRGASARADEDGQTKTIPEKNFKLTLPAAWTWDEPSDADKEAGFVLVARRTVRPTVEASVWVRVRDAGTVSLESFLSQIKDAKTKDLTDVVTEERPLEWAGVPARRLEISGKYTSGATIASETYGALTGGLFHQMDIRCVNGAEESLREEMNDLANGYALLKGSKPGEAEGDSDAGRVLKFPKFQLTWTLPKSSEIPPAKEGESPRTLRWGFSSGGVKPDLSPGENGALAIAGIVLDDGNPVVIEVFTHKAPVGFTALLLTQNDANFKNELENFSDIPAPRIDEEVQVGNLSGASRILVGKDKASPARPLYFKVHFVVLKDILFRVTVRAHEKAEQIHRAQIKEALAGLVWADAKQGIRGPWVAPFPTYTDVRPPPEPKAGEAPRPRREYDPNVEIPIDAGVIKKPASFLRIEFDRATQPEVKDYTFAVEGRKEKVYLFAGILHWRLKDLGERTPEGLLDELESQWKNAMTDPVTLTQKGGKSSKRAESLSGSKGHAYEFRGSKDGVPFVEKGWVVKNSFRVHMVRLQYGGKDAEAAFAPEVKAMLKSLKFINEQ